MQNRLICAVLVETTAHAEYRALNKSVIVRWPACQMRRPGAGRLAAGRAIGRQLGDDLPGYHQAFQLALGIGELPAQLLDLAGQLGRPVGDPFR